MTEVSGQDSMYKDRMCNLGIFCQIMWYVFFPFKMLYVSISYLTLRQNISIYIFASAFMLPFHECYVLQFTA